MAREFTQEDVRRYWNTKRPALYTLGEAMLEAELTAYVLGVDVRVIATNDAFQGAWKAKGNYFLVNTTCSDEDIRSLYGVYWSQEGYVPAPDREPGQIVLSEGGLTKL